MSGLHLFSCQVLGNALCFSTSVCCNIVALLAVMSVSRGLDGPDCKRNYIQNSNIKQVIIMYNFDEV